METSSLKTSSIGRLFDAVASILGLKDITSFHGQAAMLLEAHALNYHDQKEFAPYPICDSEGEFDLTILLGNLFDDIEKNSHSEGIALRFHQTMLKYIEWIAKRSNTSILTFSGGVFQNKLLVELIHQHLGNDYELYFHTSLSPNDESISFGQLMYYLHIDRYTEP